MSKINILTLALALAEEEVSYDITIRGLSRESYDKMPGEFDSAGPCGNPDCDCTVWEKHVDFGEYGIMTFNTTEPPVLNLATEVNLMSAQSFWATEEGKRLTSARSAAHHAATKRLKEAHAAEYEELLREERVSRGLPAETEKANVDLLKARIAQLETELEDRS